MGIILTKHYKERFHNRCCRKTKRIEDFTQKAYFLGKNINDSNYDKYLYKIQCGEKLHGTQAKIYGGFIVWFADTTAITLWPISQKLNKNLNCL